MNGWKLLRAEWDRVLGVGLIAIAGVALALGYHGVADSVFVGQQLAYVVSGGLGGLLLGAIGVGLLVSADLHDEWRKLDRIEAAIQGQSPPDQAAVGLEEDRVLPDERPTAARLALASDGFTTVLAMVLVCIAGLSVAWHHTAQATDPIAGARPLAIGAALVAAGILAFGAYPLSLRLRLTRRKRDLLGDWLLTATADARRRHRSGTPSMSSPAGFLVAEGLHRFHVDGCPTLRRVETSVVDPSDLDPRLAACGICQPR